VRLLLFLIAPALQSYILPMGGESFFEKCVANKGLRGAFFVSVANKGVSKREKPGGDHREGCKSFGFSEATGKDAAVFRMCGKYRS